MTEISLDTHSVIKTYDRYARFFDFAFGATLNHGRRTLARVLNARAGDSILEIGVGSGLMLPLYPRNVQILGIDISPNMLALARDKVARNHLSHVDLLLVDAEIACLPDGAFDHVVLPYVYSVTPHPLQLMRQAFRLCKPAGSIWVLNHFSQSNFWRFLEWPLRPFAHAIGFRTDFPYKTFVADQDWAIVAEYKVNLFSLSRLVHIVNGDRC